MHPDAAAASIVRIYLDWLAALPWSKLFVAETGLAARFKAGRCGVLRRDADRLAGGDASGPSLKIA